MCRRAGWPRAMSGFAASLRHLNPLRDPMVRSAPWRASADDAEPVIGSRFARTRWHRSANHEAPMQISGPHPSRRLL